MFKLTYKKKNEHKFYRRRVVSFMEDLQKVIKLQSILTRGWFRLRSVTSIYFAIGVW